MNANILSLFWRSFFVQAIWNFERLQNVGFAFGLYGFLRRRYPDPEKRKEAFLRHIAFFNTHPYMANILLGMVASLENDIAAGDEERKGDLNLLKNNMAGPLAAIGDTFFWATWRPFAVLLGVSIVMLFHRFDNFFGTWLAPLAFLVIYNSIPLPFRYWSLVVGYKLRTGIVEIIAHLEFKHAVDMLRFIGLLILILVLIFYSWTFASTFVDKLVFLAVFGLTVIAGCLRVSSNAIFYGITALSIIVALISRG